MITTEQKNRVAGGGKVLDEAQYHINPENVIHITQILRNLYSDPVKAVIREYISNAVDAHVETGATKEVEVHIPNTIEPHFSVRDFGGGLDVAATKQLLYGYGSSGEHKRQSNEQIGGFGVGCKSAFAICSAFTYTIWHAGMRRVWSCYLDEYDAGQAKMLEEVEDDAPAGILVQVPVSADVAEDPGNFVDKINSLFTFANMPLALTNSDLEVAETPTPIASVPLPIKVNGENKRLDVEVYGELSKIFPNLDYQTRYYSSDKETARAMITSGGIPYEVNVSELGLDPEVEKFLESEYSKPGAGQFLLVRTPIGLVQPAPNRESIQYSGSTKKILSGVYTAIHETKFLSKLQGVVESKQLAATFLEKARVVTNMPWLAANTQSDFFKLDKGFGSQSGALTCKRSHFGGALATVELKAIGTYNNTLEFRKENVSSYGDKLHYTDSSKLNIFDVEDADNHIFLVVTGITTMHPGTSRPLLNRVLTYLKENKHFINKWGAKVATPEAYKVFGAVDVLFTTGTDSVKKVPWLDGSVLEVDVSALPEVDDAEELLEVRENSRYSSRVTTGTVKRTQHARKFVKLTDKYGSTTVKSDAWTPCKATCDDYSIFTEMAKFELTSPFGNWDLYKPASKTLHHAFVGGTKDKELHDATLSILPEAAKGILGVRTGKSFDSMSEPRNDGYTYLWTYIRDTFAEDVDDEQIDVEALASALYLDAVKIETYASTVDVGPSRRSHYSGAYAQKQSVISENAAKGSMVFGARWLEMAHRLKAITELDGTNVRKRLDWWVELDEKVANLSGKTKHWYTFLTWLHASDRQSGGGKFTGLLTLLNATNVHTKESVVDWSLLAGDEIGNLLSGWVGKKTPNGSFVNAKAAADVRLDKDLAYMLEQHPMLSLDYALFLQPAVRNTDRSKPSLPTTQSKWAYQKIASDLRLSNSNYIEFLKKEDATTEGEQ